MSRKPSAYVQELRPVGTTLFRCRVYFLPIGTSEILQSWWHNAGNRSWSLHPVHFQKSKGRLCPPSNRWLNGILWRTMVLYGWNFKNYLQTLTWHPGARRRRLVERVGLAITFGLTRFTFSGVPTIIPLPLNCGFCEPVVVRETITHFGEKLASLQL